MTMKKKTASWADHLQAESELPGDAFTWTDGSNYGLDGFYFTQTMEEGLDHGDQSGWSGPIVPAQTAEIDLPEGFVTDEPDPVIDDDIAVPEDDFDLTQMLSEDEGSVFDTDKTATSLANLDWLDPTQEQDPERLPEPRDSGFFSDEPSGSIHIIPELEEAWGVKKRTDGLHLVPNKDKEIADYEKSIESGLPATPGVEKSAADIAWHIKRAVRLSTYGETIGKINVELHKALGRDSLIARRAFAQVAADHGLNGTVFVRASAFPGIKNGKWVEHLRKVARTARYVITDDPSVAAKLGMTMVTEVPWKAAFAYYAPRLRAAGYALPALKAGSTAETYKETLRRAFLTGPKVEAHAPTPKPVEVRPADTVTAEQARAAFSQAEKPTRAAVGRDEAALARKAVLVHIAKAVKAGLLDHADALRLGQSQAAPHDIQRAAADIIKANQLPRSKVYAGLGVNVTAARQRAERDAAWGALKQAELDAAQLKKAHAQVARMVESGMLTAKEAKHALAQATAAEVLKIASAIVQAAGQHRKPELRASKTREFQGPLIQAAIPSSPKPKVIASSDEGMHRLAKKSGIKVAEFKQLASWLRQQMSEGVAGGELDTLLRVRFASPLRKAAEPMVTALRKEHEGLSGFLYVDAAAYASPTGTTGCEAAAPKHRANQVKFVKAMDRCSGCVFANANGVCRKYGKELLHKLPSDAQAFRAAMLKMADAPDHELTASLFDPSEYALQGNLDVSLDSAPSSKELGDVLFGDGLHLER